MPKKLQLSIPKPCHENWDAMTPVQQGKFCGSCQKQVVDFSNMSDRQVAEFFKKPILSLSKGGSVCGRFMTDQLDRSIDIPKKRIPWLKYFFQFVIPAFLVSIKASSQKTQGKIKVTTVAKDTIRPEMRPTMGLVAPICIKPPVQKIKGDIKKLTKLSGIIQLKVVNEKGEPIPYASIETGVIGKGGAADKNGLFNLDKSILNINGQLFVSSAGYERKAIPVKTISGLTGTYTIELQIKGYMTEVVVTAMGQTRHCMTLGAVTRIEASQLIDKNVITGKVIDEKGDFLPGVNIIIKGTRKGTVSDNIGDFHIQAKKGDVLQVLGAGLELTEAIIIDDRNILISVKRMIIGAISIIRPKTKKELKNVPLMPAVTDGKHILAFKIFPNPVGSGSNLNIELKQTEEGYYSLQLLDQSGQSVYQQQIWIDADARLLNLDIPPVAAGSYFLSLTNKKSGKRFTEKLIIQ